MRSLLSTVPALALFALATSVGCSSEPSVDARPGPGRSRRQIVPVVVAEPELISIEDVFLEREASLRPIVDTTISSQQEGVINRVYPQIGDVVNEGDPIAQLDEVDYKLALAERRAELDEAEVTLKERERNWRRTEELYEKRVVSADERGDRRLSLDRARAELQKARVRAERAEHDLASLRLVAPFPGVIAAVHADVGSYVQRGDPIVRLKRVDWIVALCTVSERDLAHVREGATVRVTLPAFPGRSFEGLVWKIVPDAFVASRSFPVNVLLRNPTHELKSGMSARVAFVRHLDQALLISKDAVMGDEVEPFVWVAHNGTAERRPVTLGAAFDDRLHVREGLKAGEAVIVTGNEFLERGSRIEVVELPPPGPPTLPAARETDPALDAPERG